MRITYYRFPEETPEAVLLEHGCGVLLKDGQEIYPESIPDERRAMVESICHHWLLHNGVTSPCQIMPSVVSLPLYSTPPL